MDPVFDRVPSEASAAGADDRGRDSLCLVARLQVVGAETETIVQVRNLSSGGLMVELPEPLEPDSMVRIELSGLGWIAGRIAWQTEGRAGIAFDRPVDPHRAHHPAD